MIANHLAQFRQRRGIAAADLAQRVGVSRQTIHAIESGAYVPNTAIALRLARELEASVEDLFALPSPVRAAPEPVNSDLLSASPLFKAQTVRLCRIGEKWISIPATATPYYLPDADGVISRLGPGRERAAVATFESDEVRSKQLVLAGCDPATSLLARMVEKISGVEIVPAAASSKLALEWLKRGRAHIAGTHLEDAKTREFNVPYLRRHFADRDWTVVTFARWEEGFVVRSGNPKCLRAADDLTRRDVVFVNREPGSGSRALIDRLLAQAGVAPQRVDGYGQIAFGHLAAAWRVASGTADCCLATRPAARAFGLDFVPLQEARYDLVLPRQSLGLPAMQAFLDVLQHAALRRKLEIAAGYDTSRTGGIVV